jgi:predicted RND superfamily exporter protein
MLLNIQKINRSFEGAAWILIRRRWLFLLAFVVTIILSLYGSTLIRIDTSNENSFLAGDSINIQTDQFEEIFGNDQYIGILVENEELFTCEKLMLLRELHEELLDSVPFLERVTSLNDLEFTVGTEYGMSVEQLIPDVIPQDQAEIDQIRDQLFRKHNLRSRLVSSDASQTWISIKFLPFPDDWQEQTGQSPEELVGKTVLSVIGQEKYAELNPKAAGMPVINYQKRVYFEKESARVMGTAVFIAILILALALRSFWGVIIPLFSAISSILIVYGVTGFLGVPIDNMVLTFPFLIGFAVSIAYSIHLFSFFKRHFRQHGHRKAAIIHSFGEVGWAVMFTALTTVTALLSALFIPVKTVRFMGLSTAGVVVATFLVVMVLTPVLLSFGKNRKPDKKKVLQKHTRMERGLQNMGTWILDHPRKILISYLLVTVVLIIGTTRVKVDTDPRKSLGLKIPYVQNLFHLAQTELGTLYSYDVMIELPEAGMAKEPEVLKKLEALEETAQASYLTKKTQSILDVIKDMNQVLNADDPAFYRLPEERNLVAQLLLLYENAGGTESEYWVDYDYKYLRLSVFLEDMKISEMKDAFTEITTEADHLFPDSEVMVVGTIPQFMKMIQYVTKGQVVSFGIAMLVIAGLMMIVFGSVKTGLIALIPNVTPALMIGGIMGFFDIPLDYSTVLIMPMILGLAVDDTIHFINHSRLEFMRTRNYRESIIKSMRSVGVALIFTTLVLSGNFLSYMTSEVRFYFFLGVLAIAGMLSALLADFFVTPQLFQKFHIFGQEQPLELQPEADESKKRA